MDDVVFFSVFFRNLELLDKIRNETQSALSVAVAMGRQAILLAELINAGEQRFSCSCSNHEPVDADKDGFPLDAPMA